MADSSVAKLPSPLKDLVLGAKPNFGKSDEDKVEILNLIEKVSQGDVAKPEGIKDLETQLVSSTYIVSNYLTAADVALYGALHPVLSQLQPAQYYSHPAVTRYFDHIQSAPSVRQSADILAPAFSMVEFDIENAPKPERKAEPPKKKEKKVDQVAEAVVGAAVAAKDKVTAVVTDAKPGKEKKEKKKDAAKAPAAAEDAGEPVPSMIDLRVGHIVDIKKHPDADGLYIEVNSSVSHIVGCTESILKQIDIGEDTGPRTVVSGLVHYIPIEQMQDKYLVAVATSKDGKDAGIELIQPPPGSKPGDRIYFEGADFERFITLDTKEAAWVNPATKSVHKIRTKAGFCMAPTLVGASLS
ncbi:hypothetical protein HWV62_25172 [Athelia sp. TMB]|nr:hypothetical protein HWV62_25172 [Athelia sp. TMB]